MSQDTIVAKRYAKALFELAKEQNRVAEVEAELRGIETALKQNVDFRKLIVSPGLDASVKAGLIKSVFEGQISETTMNTLLLLIQKGREELLEALITYYMGIASEALGQANATVYSPIALNDAELSQIAATFSQITGKQIRVESVLDKSLIGGIQVRIGDRLYDGSLSGKLQRLQKTLNQSQAL
ncbi:F0F1 ATP synthase subunit delta [Paenibacillus allorhizosphaerae]|uniref:ATP synthase subunit delta n=1 Tax=Paenibacillus allorhizosphaerae TaxID=2849866 RepID=A0ABM8VRT8_9BACL|nr:F0F1 ATP synthase subunit delta [Paenibacillus allorhizosphaerae]CAG7655609.1 ATP synthase subunit delta [Paenibacillus allorhizosphaerae]